MRYAPWFWGAWAASGVFVETLALYSRRYPQDTLSENIRSVVCRPHLRKVTLAGWLGFVAWFTPHIWG